MTVSEIPSLTSQGHEADPHRTYALLRKHSPVHRDPATRDWVISRHEDIRWILKNDVFSTKNYAQQHGRVFGRTILEMEGREHLGTRRLVNPFLTGGGLESFLHVPDAVARRLAEPIFEREAEAIAHGDRAHGVFELVSEYSSLYPISVICEMLGVPEASREDMRRWYMWFSEFIENLAGDEAPRRRGLRAREELDRLFYPLIRKRRGGDGTDLISLLVNAEVDDVRLSDDEVRSFAGLIVSAGGETTASGIASLFKNLIENPDQLHAVYDDRSLIEDAFAETLRFSAPAQIIRRQAREDVELHGVTMAAGDTVSLVLASGNRDESVFAEPDEFDIFRDDNSTARAFAGSAQHEAFGGGRHFCVGAVLSRSEVRMATNVLLDHMASPPRFVEGFTPRDEGVWFRHPRRLEVAFDPVT
jgi:cytochrome P450